MDEPNLKSTGSVRIGSSRNPSNNMAKKVFSSKKSIIASKKDELQNSRPTLDGTPNVAICRDGMFRQFIENLPVMFYAVEPSPPYKPLYISPSVVAFGYDFNQWLNDPNIWKQAILEQDREQVIEDTKLAMEAGEGIDFEYRIVGADGNIFWVRDRSCFINDASGNKICWQGVILDITERKLADEALNKTLSLFSSAFESSADGIIVMGLDQNIVVCNKRFRKMWHVPKPIIDDKTGLKLNELIVEQLVDPESFISNIDKLFANPKSWLSDLLVLKDGRTFERYSQPQMMDDVPVGRVFCYRDITARNKAEEKLRHYAMQDTLTNLPNRVSFMNHLKMAVERVDGNNHSRFGVLFLDLDRFKLINDTLGHSIGDKLLIAVAERLKVCVRPGDVVARLGGDEFTILLNRSGGIAEVANVAGRLQAKIGEPFKIDNYEVFTTASIGIVVSGSVKRKPEDFLRDADAAMYRAKESGKAHYEIFDREMHVRNMNLMQVEKDLRRAVKKGEFEVVYQPIIDILTGSVREFEALIRWRHPEHGLVLPNEFVGVAEETGLIIPIGKWILDESCRQTADWQRRFSDPLSISVNLSAKQLMHPTLTAQVKDALFVSGLNASRLKLEFTESTVIENSEKALKVLCGLDEMGIQLSTDDFGTGYSSLSYLQRFPFERLKIDRSFISKMGDDEKSDAIVKTILMLGINLNIEVVAEGIETMPQLDLLRSLGCRIGQGYLFSPPIGAAAAEEFLRNGLEIFSSGNAVNFGKSEPADWPS